MLINLRCAHGTFVVAEGWVGHEVNADRATAGDWELFALCDPLGVPFLEAPSDDDEVTIRAKPGHPDSRLFYPHWREGTVRATALTPLGATLTIKKIGGADRPIADGDTVAFRSPNRIARFPFDPDPQWGWLTAELDGVRPVVADRRRDDPGAWELFTIRVRGSLIPPVDLRGRHTQTPSHASGFQMTPRQYQERFDLLAGLGYRLLWVHGSPAPAGGTQYAAVWVRDRTGVAWRARHGIDGATFDSTNARCRDDGLDLVCLSGYPTPRGTRYAAVWWARTSGVEIQERHDLPAGDYQARFDELVAGGAMPTCVTAWPDGNHARYAGLFRRPATGAWFARHGLSDDAHQTLFDTPPLAGARPLSVAGAHVGGHDEFASVFVVDGVPWMARHGSSDGDLHMDSLRRGARGWEPTSLSGYGNGWTSKYTGVWIRRPRRFVASGPPGQAAFITACDDVVRDFMRARGIRGLMLAATVDDRLLMARGYGDDTGEEPPIEPTSLSRIASISKPFTSVAVFRLVEDGQLSLDDTMMSILNPSLGATPPQGADIHGITVRHLLRHLGGWRFTSEADGAGPDAVDHLDPMFLDAAIALRLGKTLPITTSDIIEFMSRFRPVDSEPGTTYSYSNYGYCLLGRIIEAKSGQGYETFVREQILDPLGLGRMRLARSKFNRRAPGEVAYYTRGVGLAPSVRDGDRRPVMNAYGAYNIENMDSHGGWLASAVDLVRFAGAFGRQPARSVLRRDTIKIMLDRPLTPSGDVIDSNYACGWSLRGDGSHGHNGSLPGTFAEMRSDWTVPEGNARNRRVCYAVLSTCRNPWDDLPLDADGVQEFLSDRNLLGDLTWDLTGLIEGLITARMPDPATLPELIP
jgi:CubicO group peptidase (beta-lactamase class C family)